ncbi:MAG: IS200/IS605 family transposase [Candidatus Neomarinimicrobiota bacterium]
MPQSLSHIILHLVFSTKNRYPWLDEPIRSALHAYLSTVVRNTGCECYRVGGVADHVHLAIRFSRTITVAALVEEIKTSSSKWLKTQSPKLHSFAWQRGYGVFSVGQKDLDRLLAYIDNQEDHHSERTFQYEYRAFLKKYRMTYDERYIWD